MRKWVLLAALGCAVLSTAQTTTTPSFNKEVVRIFQANCQNCHHPGTIAPFSLMDYQSARPWAVSIKQYVIQKLMPPWKPSQGADVFVGARILSQADVNTLSAWSDAGAPQCAANLASPPQLCDPNDPDLPAPLVFKSNWALGQPDLVMRMPVAFSVPAEGTDIYRCFSLPTNLPANTYVSAIQVMPGDPTVVHHVVMYSDPTGISQQLDAADPAPGYSCFGDPGFSPDTSFIAAWAPGFTPAYLPTGMAMQIPKGGFMALQVHYHLSGTATSDQTQVGVYFTKGPVDKIVYFDVLLNTSFTIPAGNSHFPVTAHATIPADFHLVTIGPHMHLLGTESHVSLTNGAAVTPLIDINAWDFQWQNFYQYVQPVPGPSGSTVQFTEYFDNSANNAKNPNSPPIPVSWGEQTTDEMAVAFFGYTVDTQHLIAPTFAAANVVNAASFAGGSVAPGGIVSLFGVGLGSNWASASGAVPTTLAKTKISLGGVPAPLFYASPSQVNLQIPYEVDGATTLTLTRDDNDTTTVNLTVAAAQPGLFSADSSGTGPAAATLPDGSFLSSANPVATDGSGVVVLYATGLGRVNGAATTGVGASGAATVANQVKVSLGGHSIDPDYAGLTPGFVGLYQINVRIPAGLGLTGNVPLTVIEAGVSSNTVTIAVR